MTWGLLWWAIRWNSERLRSLFHLSAHHNKTHVIYSELLKSVDHPAVQAVLDHVLERRIGCLFGPELQRTVVHHDAWTVRRRVGEPDGIELQCGTHARSTCIGMRASKATGTRPASTIASAAIAPSS